MLNRLPAELVLSVLGYCGAQTISTVRLASREWQHFITQNENAVYRAAAIYHGFARLSQTIEDVSAEWSEIISESESELESESESEDGDGGVFRGWIDYCQRRFLLEKTWEGRGAVPKTRLYRSTGKDVHRFKLDEREDARFVITTHRGGGLRVTCMDSDAVLFELGKVYVRNFAHCEYGNGFLVFDRFHPHALEIWRLTSEWDGETIPESNVLYRPDDEQLTAPRRVLDPTGRGRGSFSPWALFTPRENPRAYRFVYPHLLVGSEWGQKLYVFDVRSATLVEVIAIPETATVAPGGQGVQINYVELGARHAFVCTPYSVLVIPRFQSRRRGLRVGVGEASDEEEENGEEAVRYLEFPSADPALKNPQLVRHYALRMVQTRTFFGVPRSTNEAMSEYMLTTPRVPEQSTALVPFEEGRQEFTAVHVSADGRHFVAVTVLGVAYFVRDFERAVRGETSLSRITLRINLGTAALNLVFEHDRAVISTLHGVFVFNLHTGAPYDAVTPPKHHHPGRSEQTPLDEEEEEEPLLEILPRLSVYQLMAFRNPLSLRLVSCVKVTRTGVWVDWSARALEEVEGRVAPLADGEAEAEGEGEGEGEGEHPYATRMVCRIDFSPREDVEETRYRRYQGTGTERDSS